MIERIGSANAEATTVTIPAGHKMGDLILIYAFRSGSVTNPTVPSGWQTVTNTLDGTLCSVSVGYKYAVSASETSGTWTNASCLLCVVYRGAKVQISPIGASTNNAASSTSITYGLIVPRGRGSSWIVDCVAIRGTDTTTLNNPRTGMTNLQYLQGTGVDAALFDTNQAYGLSSLDNAAIAHGGASAAYISYSVEIYSFTSNLNNYQMARVGDGMGTGERLR